MIKKDIIESVDVSTRSKRRQAILFVIALLEHIQIAEEANVDRFPLNLQNSDAYSNAENSIEAIADTIICLMDAY